MAGNNPELAAATKKTSRSKTTGRARLSQKAIVNVAADLFARNGFGATSLDDIADQLGATKGALYYHIKNKEDILRHIYLMVLTASEEPLAEIARSQAAADEKLSRAIAHHVSVAASRSPAMMVFY
ncbi:MAG: TetR/AcrR family transcriptional regulator, partial [Ktedonobacterales bacterium]